MTMVDTLQRRGSDPPAGATVRQAAARRALPNGRAVVGALLITASVFGVYWAWAAASRPPTTAYVTAARDLVVGDTLTADDLTMVALDLPDAMRGAAFTATGDLAGAVVLGPIRAGELVQTGAVAKTLGGAALQEMAFAIEPSRALGGRLKAGQRVDVLATFGVGADTYTTAVVRNALVLRIERDGSGLGSSAAITVTVGLAAADDPLALAHALNAGDVFLATTGSRAADAPSTYRAPGSREAGSEAR